MPTGIHQFPLTTFIKRHPAAKKNFDLMLLIVAIFWLDSIRIRHVGIECAPLKQITLDTIRLASEMIQFDGSYGFLN